LKKSDNSGYVYSLVLADGQQWNIKSNENSRELASSWAKAMGLQPYELKEGTNLIVVLDDCDKSKNIQEMCSVDKDLMLKLPRKGWKSRQVKYIRIWYNDAVKDVVCKLQNKATFNGNIMGMWYTLHPIYHRAQDSGGLPLHGALLEWKGNGIVLSAPSKTGKSTCCRRLPLHWRALCDDETLIVSDKQKQYMAHPIPSWSEYIVDVSKRTWNVQHHVPLKAFFFLEQAEKDEAIPIGHGQAAILINQSAIAIYRKSLENLVPEEKMVLKKKIFDNACELSKAIPSFVLRFSLAGQFWDEMEKVL